MICYNGISEVEVVSYFYNFRDGRCFVWLEFSSLV